MRTVTNRDHHGAARRALATVWLTGQHSAPGQPRGRYLPESTAHPAKMLPAIAAHAISLYTRPGDLVLDPMCGVGTTLVEAAHLGHDSVGVEYEARWAALADNNLALARQHGATGAGQVFTGDARRLDAILPDHYRNHAALVVTSPPYGASLHGQVDATPA